MADAHMLLLCCQVSGGRWKREGGQLEERWSWGCGLGGGGCPLGPETGRSPISLCCHNPLPIVRVIATSIGAGTIIHLSVTRGKISTELGSIFGNNFASLATR